MNGNTQTELMPGFDIFGDLDFFVAAEPLFFRNAAPRVLLTAVRLDTLVQVKPWLSRIGATHAIAYARTPVL